MDVKRQITTELASVVKAAVRENRSDNAEFLTSDIVNAVCNVTEAICIHGLKESRGASSTQRKSKSSQRQQYPEPNFWPFVQKFTHRNIRAQIGNLSQIKTDIGKSRVWIRIALNDHLLESYMTAVVRDQPIVRHYYNHRAFLRDSEQCDLMLNYMRALDKLNFKAPLNSSILNEWTPTPLQMAGLLTERRPPSNAVYSPGAVMDMEAIDEDGDIAVAVSALEYDGLDDPAFSDDYDVRSESQFSIQSRPVNVYGDRRVFSTPDDSSPVDIENLSENVNVVRRPIGQQRKNNDLERVYESMHDEDGTKLDAILCAITRSNGSPTESGVHTDEKNPFSDSGVVASPSQSVDVALQTQSTSSKILKEEETQTILPAEEKIEENIEIEKSEETNEKKPSEETYTETLEENNEVFVSEISKNEKENTTEPQGILDEEKHDEKLLEQLEMSFSPGNSLAGYGWSSPSFDVVQHQRFQGPGSPSSSGTGNGSAAGFAALFSTVMNRTGGGGSASSSPIFSSFLAGNNSEDEKVKKSRHGSLDGAGAGEKAETVVVEVNTKSTDDLLVKPVVHVSETTDMKRSPSLDNFVVVEESQESLDHAAAQKSYRMSLLTKVAPDAGLDTQDFKCYSCQRSIGLPLFGGFRVCSYDGHYYCTDCHLNEEKIIPARVLLNWDLKPRPVSRASKAFLDHVADQPLIDLQSSNPTLPEVVNIVRETKKLRLQLSYVAMYLLTCKESVGEDLRKRVWPKEYLYTNVNLYSITDLSDMAGGQLQKHLKSLVQYATKHVLQQCRLCAQKGFICELCNDRKIIYAFQLDLTYRCSKCLAVYHMKCMGSQTQQSCPKCVRRDLYTQQSERSSLSFDNVLPLGF